MGDERRPRAPAPTARRSGARRQAARADEREDGEPRGDEGQAAGQREVERGRVGPVRLLPAAVLALVPLVDALVEGDAIALGADPDERVVAHHVRGDAPLVQPAPAAGAVRIGGVADAGTDRGEEQHQHGDRRRAEPAGDRPTAVSSQRRRAPLPPAASVVTAAATASPTQAARAPDPRHATESSPTVNEAAAADEGPPVRPGHAEGDREQERRGRAEVGR